MISKSTHLPQTRGGAEGRRGGEDPCTTTNISQETLIHRRFVGQPRSEMDQAWHDLLQGTMIRFSEEELSLAANSTSIRHKSGGYVGGLGISHSLHCIVSTHPRMPSSSRTSQKISGNPRSPWAPGGWGVHTSTDKDRLTKIDRNESSNTCTPTTITLRESRTGRNYSHMLTIAWNHYVKRQCVLPIRTSLR